MPRLLNSGLARQVPMPLFVILRHGETQWARENRFAGWGDTPLSEAGKTEVAHAAKAIVRQGMTFQRCYTSRLQRARQSVEILHANNVQFAGTISDWRLNERHYGALQGLTRSAVIEKYGNAQTVEWRRSFTETPPSLEQADPRWYEQLQRFSDVDAKLQPAAESIKTAAARVSTVWEESIKPDLQSGDNILLVAHTSSIRGITRLIENLDGAQTAAFRIATSMPLVYEFAPDLATYKKREISTGTKGLIRQLANRLKPRRFAKF